MKNLKMSYQDEEKELKNFFDLLARISENEKKQNVKFEDLSVFTSSIKVEIDIDSEIKKVIKIINKPFVIYGAGAIGSDFIEFCKQFQKTPLAVIDKRFKKEEKFCEISAMNLDLFIKKYSSIIQKLFVFITTIQKKFQDEIKTLLLKNGFKEKQIIILSPAFGAYITPWTKNFLKKTKEFYLDNKNKILKTITFFKDKKSKEIFVNLIKIYASGNRFFIPFSSKEEPYFPKDIIFYKKISKIVHAGAFVGDTVKKLVKNIGKIDKLICFEPDLENFKSLVNYIQKNKEKIAKEIITFPSGLWERTGYLHFKGAGTGGHISSEGEKFVQVVSIDDVLIDLETDYFIMDIEGAELEALYGAKKFIKKWKPNLGICVYHKPEHLWEIPLFLQSLVPDYCLYLRNYTGAISETVLYAIIKKEKE